MARRRFSPPRHEGITFITSHLLGRWTRGESLWGSGSAELRARLSAFREFGASSVAKTPLVECEDTSIRRNRQAVQASAHGTRSRLKMITLWLFSCWMIPHSKMVWVSGTPAGKKTSCLQTFGLLVLLCNPRAVRRQVQETPA